MSEVRGAEVRKRQRSERAEVSKKDQKAEVSY